MKARLAQKILKAKLDFQEFRRYDFPYRGQQLYAASKRAGIPIRYRDRFYKNWRRVSKIEGKAICKELFKLK